MFVQSVIPKFLNQGKILFLGGHMRTYLKIVRNILDKGVKKEDRTGTGTIAIAGTCFEHDMKEGFPLLTTKSVPFRLVASELEFFIKGKGLGFGMGKVAPGQVEALKKVVPAGID